jgi:hypothetical protein
MVGAVVCNLLEGAQLCLMLQQQPWQALCKRICDASRCAPHMPDACRFTGTAAVCATLSLFLQASMSSQLLSPAAQPCSVLSDILMFSAMFCLPCAVCCRSYTGTAAVCATLSLFLQASMSQRLLSPKLRPTHFFGPCSVCHLLPLLAATPAQQQCVQRSACSCRQACQTRAGSLLRQQRCTSLHTPQMGCCSRQSSAARVRWRDRDGQSTAEHAAGMHQVLYFVHQVVYFVYSTSCCSIRHVLVWFPAADNNSAARVRLQDQGGQSTAEHAAGALWIGCTWRSHQVLVYMKISVTTWS